MTETHPNREAAMRRATELRNQGYRVRIARKGYQGFYRRGAKQPTEYIVMADK